MFKLFDPKRVFIKILLFSCLIALIWNGIFLYENDRLLSHLIRRIDLFEFCYKLDLENITKTITALGEFSIITNRNQIELIVKIKDNIFAIEKILDNFREKINEKTPIDDIEKIKHANVLISNLTDGFEGSGTHIKINNKNYVLTCAHLSEKDTDEMYAIVENEKEYCLELIKIDRDNDLALYTIAENNEPYLELSQEIPKEGSEVVVIGNPTRYTDVVTNGIIAKKLKKEYVVTNLAFYGNSGGALIYKGKIVGVVIVVETYYHLKRRKFVNYTRCVNLVTIREFLNEVENK